MTKGNDPPTTNSPDHRDRVALILEASSPASAETAQTLASHDTHLALHYNSSNKPNTIITTLLSSLTANHPSILTTMHTAPLSSPAEIDALFADVLAKHGRIDMVVNGKGEMLQKPVAQLTEAEREQLLAYTQFVGEQGRACEGRLREELERRVGG